MRLRTLVAHAILHQRGGLLAATLSAAADHPLVRPVLQQVTAQRLRFIADAYAELGFPRPEAERRALARPCGSRPVSEALASLLVAAAPPTRVGNGAGAARRSRDQTLCVGRGHARVGDGPQRRQREPGQRGQ
jgi:hypothetical protein